MTKVERELRELLDLYPRLFLPPYSCEYCRGSGCRSCNSSELLAKKYEVWRLQDELVRRIRADRVRS